VRTLILDPQEHALAEQHAARLGRRVVELRRSSRERLCLLSWADEFAPAAGDDRLQLRGLTPVPLLTFACCLSLCWHDAEQPPYPGVETSERAVLEAARRLTPAETHVKSALRHGLVSVGLVDYD